MKINNTYVLLLILFCLVIYSSFWLKGTVAPVVGGSFTQTTANTQLNEKIENIPVLMYHYVEYNQNKEDTLRDSLNIPPDIFEKQLITLKNAGYKFITPDQLPYLKQSEFVQYKFVIITFDDGYADFYTDVFPILKRNNAKAVNYVVFNFIGNLNYMTADQVAEVGKSGLVEIGSHTMNHRWLPTSRDDIRVLEVKESKTNLEKLLGKPVVSFAYPYGAFDQPTVDLVKQAGYLTAVTTNDGMLTSNSDFFTIERIRPGYNTGEDLILLLESKGKSSTTARE